MSVQPHQEFPWDFRLKATIRQLARGRRVTDKEIRDIIIRVLRAQVDKRKP